MQQQDTSEPNLKKVMLIVSQWREAELKNEGLWAVEPSDGRAEGCLYCIGEDGMPEDIYKRVMAILKKELPKSEAQLFLHGSAGLTQADIREIHRMANNEISPEAASRLNCTLFGGGKNYLYIRPDGTGIVGPYRLGGKRQYSRSADSTAKEWKKVEVILDEDKRIISHKNFEDVWSFYASKLKDKIYTLEHDLFLHLAGCIAMANDKEQESQEVDLCDHIARDRLLQARLINFVDHEEAQALQAIQEAERKTGYHYRIDKCAQYLKEKAIKGELVKQHYQELASTIQRQLLEHDSTPARELGGFFKKLQGDFEELWTALPEKTYQ